MNIDSYAWTTDGSERTSYPAQVQIRVRLRCHPLPEEQFKPIIIDNYYHKNHFWFELDHAQTSKLLSMLSSLAVAPSTFAPQNMSKCKILFHAIPLHSRREENEGSNPPAGDVGFSHSYKSTGFGPSDVATSLDASNQSLEGCLDKQQMGHKDGKDLIHMKLKELALRECSDLSLTASEDSAAVHDVQPGHIGLPEPRMNSNEKKEENIVSSIANSFDRPPVLGQLIQEMEELKAFKAEQSHKMHCLQRKLVEAETEIQQLKYRCMVLESVSHPSVVIIDDHEMAIEPFNHLELDLDELIFLVGGYDGMSWLSALVSYSPKEDVIKNLKPMNSVRSYASVAKLNGELYVFGGGHGGHGCLWYDTVESYNPASNEWTPRPSLNLKVGSLAGATLNDKIFAFGGGNGVECFADVQMFDSDVGRWISTRSMLQKRFALAGAELNGALYAVGGYDGKDYLRSAERFDPRELSWTRIESMNTKRGCHSMVVLDEKLYAIGGYDGSAMVSSVEIFDPRLGVWLNGEPMDQSRGYAAAAVLKGAIYAIGGVKTGDTIVDKVERYEEGQGWKVTHSMGIEKRCFCSAITL